MFNVTRSDKSEFLIRRTRTEHDDVTASAGKTKIKHDKASSRRGALFQIQTR